MINLLVSSFLPTEPHKAESRAMYRATTLTGEVIVGQLVTIARRTLFRGYKTKDYIRGYITGRLHSFRANTLALCTGVNDENGKPICNGDKVYRWDSYTKKAWPGEVRYSTQIGAWIFCQIGSTYNHRDLLMTEMNIQENNNEFTITYKYTLA